MFSRFNAHNTLTDTHSHISGQWDWRKGFWKEKGFHGRFKRTYRGHMTDRNRELVPHSWSLVRERPLITGLCSEGWYSEHSGVCRRAELLGRSVKKKCSVTTVIYCYYYYYKWHALFYLSCLLQTYYCLSINEKLLVSWQFSGTYGITKYSSGWRKDVVNQCLEFEGEGDYYS